MAAHSLRECRGAMARRGGPLPYLGYPVTPMLAHMLPRAVGAADFSTTEKRRRACARGRAQSARVSGSDGATGQAATFPVGVVSRLCGMAHEHFTVGQLVAGGSTRDVPTLTG